MATAVAPTSEERAQPARLPGEKEQRPRPVIAKPTDAPVRKATRARRSGASPGSSASISPW